MTIEWMMEQLLQDMQIDEERDEQDEEAAFAAEIDQAAMDGMIYMIMKWMERSGIDHSVMNNIGQQIGPDMLDHIAQAQKRHIDRVVRLS